MAAAISNGFVMRFAWISLPIACWASQGLAQTPPETNGQIRILVQSSPLAGSQYHQLSRLRDIISVGDPLELGREPQNPYDPNAVSVRWRGKMLGYLPRRENKAVAAAMDRGESIKAFVETLVAHPDPWQRLRISVFLEL